MSIDSDSMGDGSHHRVTADLEARFAELSAAPTDRGRLVYLVVRGEGGRRAAPERMSLTRDGGVEGDAWARRPDRKPDAQVTVMQAAVAGMIANGQELDLFGDNLFVDLDLSAANLPPGARIRIGETLLEVTPLPHRGCRKFQARFGEDALRFISRPEFRDLRLRGMHARVLRGGEIGKGDDAIVVLRSQAL